MEFLGLILGPTVAAAIVSLLLSWLRPRWSLGRTVAVSALAVPSVIALYCLWMIAEAAATPQERCGTDACGMITVVAMMGIGYAAMMAVIGLIPAAWVKRRFGRP